MQVHLRQISSRQAGCAAGVTVLVVPLFVNWTKVWVALVGAIVGTAMVERLVDRCQLRLRAMVQLGRRKKELAEAEKGTRRSGKRIPPKRKKNPAEAEKKEPAEAG
jgi:hypothetical protein